jgi:hypothetical protein
LVVLRPCFGALLARRPGQHLLFQHAATLHALGWIDWQLLQLLTPNRFCGPTSLTPLRPARTGTSAGWASSSCPASASSLTDKDLERQHAEHGERDDDGHEGGPGPPFWHRARARQRPSTSSPRPQTRARRAAGAKGFDEDEGGHRHEGLRQAGEDAPKSRPAYAHPPGAPGPGLWRALRGCCVRRWRA